MICRDCAEVGRPCAACACAACRPGDPEIVEPRRTEAPRIVVGHWTGGDGYREPARPVVVEPSRPPVDWRRLVVLSAIGACTALALWAVWWCAVRWPAETTLVLGSFGSVVRLGRAVVRSDD